MIRVEIGEGIGTVKLEGKGSQLMAEATIVVKAIADAFNDTENGRGDRFLNKLSELIESGELKKDWREDE